MTKVLKIGIDFGGVLSIHDRVYGDKGTGEAKEAKEDKADVCQHRSTAINMPAALETLAALKNTKIDGIDKIEYHLISFAGKTRAKETMDSILLCAPNLFDSLYFTKSKQNKKFVCAHLGISVMIDDTLDILTDISHLTNKPRLILFTGDPSFHEHNEPLDKTKNGIIEIQTWIGIAELIKTVPWNSSDLVAPDPKINLTKYVYQL